MSQLRAAVDALAAVAERAGLSGSQARDEGLVFAAAIAESAPRAAQDWVAARDGKGLDLSAANAAFFDAASRGRKWRQSPTTLLAELTVADLARAGEYARALADVASAACTLGEPTMRVTGNASVAAAAQLGAAAPAVLPPDGRDLLAQLAGWQSGTHAPSGPLPLRGAPGDATERHTEQTGASAREGEQQAAAAEPEPQPVKSVEELLGELDAMIGLERVKREVHQQVAMLKVDAMRQEAGLKSPEITRHLVFVGNPGTGKTTVARMVGGIYRALGLLSKGQLVEVDRSELVAGYLGQTAIKTAETCVKAYGGVLFIDEAYALSGDQYGQEAVNTIVKEMEDHRDDLVVIVAGYPDPMVVFIAQNPGLASRFKTVIEFEDYTDEEIVGILHKLAASSDYTVTAEAESRFRDVLAATARDQSFGNGRFARNLLEEAIGRHAWRLHEATAPTPEQLRELHAEDFESSGVDATRVPADRNPDPPELALVDLERPRPGPNPHETGAPE